MEGDQGDCGDFSVGRGQTLYITTALVYLRKDMMQSLQMCECTHRCVHIRHEASGECSFLQCLCDSAGW